MAENLKDKLREEEAFDAFKKLANDEQEKYFIKAMAMQHHTTPDNIGYFYQDDEFFPEKHKKIYYLKRVFGPDGKVKTTIDSENRVVPVQPIINSGISEPKNGKQQ